MLILLASRATNVGFSFTTSYQLREFFTVPFDVVLSIRYRCVWLVVFCSESLLGAMASYCNFVIGMVGDILAQTEFRYGSKMVASLDTLATS